MAALTHLALVDVFCIIVTVGLVSLYFSRARRQRGLRPPGPRPLPLLGNLLDVPTEQPWEKYTEWGAIYGKYVVAHLFV